VTSDYVRVWVNDVLIINQWGAETDGGEPNPCGGTCTGQIDLNQSADSDRVFSRIRIDYYHVKGITQIKNAAIGLYWSSFSQGYQLIPTSQLFSGEIIRNGGTACLSITIVPGAISGANSYALFPTESLQAGESYNVLITAKDAFGNVLQTTDSVFRVTANALTFSSMPAGTPGQYYAPIQFSVKGTYTVSVDYIAPDASTETVTVSVSSIVVGAGIPYEVVYDSILPTSPVAGQSFTVSVKILDAYGTGGVGNELTDSTAAQDVYVNAMFAGDSSTDGMLPYIDTFIREQRYGMTFVQSAVVYQSAGIYVATMNLPFRGSYNLEMGVHPSSETAIVAVPATTTITGVKANPSVAGVYSVITSTPFPPSELIAGTSTTITVQLRDEYMNIITTGDDALSPVPTVLLQASQMANTTCTSPTTLGLYSCTFTPAALGSEIYLALIVNNAFASYLDFIDSSGIVHSIPGPWAIPLLPGAIDPASCTVSGIRSVYVVDAMSEIIITLKDAYGNKIGVAQDPDPEIVVQLHGEEMTDMSFNSDGTITVTILPSTTFNDGVMVVTINGVSVDTSNFPSAIDCVVGSVDAHSSVCEDIGATSIVAGAAFTYTCTIKDAGANAISKAGLDVDTYYEHTTDSAVVVLPTTAVYGGGSTYTATTVSPLTTSGVYSFYTLLGQLGGLMGQYYAASDFSNLIGINDTPLFDLRFANEPPVQYTRIDPFLSFDWEGYAEIDNVNALSIKWSGYIRPADISVTNTYRVSAYGGVKITIGTDVKVDLLTATTVTNQVFTIAPTSTTPILIVIEYLPAVGSAMIEFEQLEPGPIYKTVPPSVLQAPLRVPHTASTYEITVIPAVVSTSSIAIMSSSPYVQNVPEEFSIQPKDVYGNLHTTNCLILAANACSWQISLVQADGAAYMNATTLGATVAYKANGLLTVSITFTVSGPEYVKVELSTNAGSSWNAISGSPYTVTVNAQ
jgi:hypothetical protein